MTFEDLKNRLEDGTVLVFGKILNATHNVRGFGEEVVTDPPEELEEETLQKLPRFDFSAKVHAQKVLRKLGYTV